MRLSLGRWNDWRERERLREREREREIEREVEREMTVDESVQLVSHGFTVGKINSISTINRSKIFPVPVSPAVEKVC